jgi:hypothetical protein
VPRNYCWFITGQGEHRRMLEASIESVRRHDPRAALHVIDADSALAPAGPMMLANIDAIWTVLANLPRGDELIALDCDTIVQAPLPLLHLGEAQADLAVTFRDHVARGPDGEKQVGIAGEQPYNFGVLGFRASPGGLEACLWLRERVRRMGPQLRAWYGNQVALAELLGPCPKDDQPDLLLADIPWADDLTGTGITVARWPCQEWNFTPEPGESYAHARVLHFKGHSRDLFGPTAKELGLPW